MTKCTCGANRELTNNRVDKSFPKYSHAPLARDLLQRFPSRFTQRQTNFLRDISTKWPWLTADQREWLHDLADRAYSCKCNDDYMPVDVSDWDLPLWGA